MEQTEVSRIARRWSRLSGVVLELKKIPEKQLQQLLKDSYEALYAYHQAELVPKAVASLMLEMGDFLYFASLMEEKEVTVDFYYYQAVDAVIQALKTGFFRGEYPCRFPLLQLRSGEVLDLEKGFWHSAETKKG